MNLRFYSSTHTHIHARMHTHIHARMHILTKIYTRTHENIHTRADIEMHTNTDIYSHSHTQVCKVDLQYMLFKEGKNIIKSHVITSNDRGPHNFGIKSRHEYLKSVFPNHWAAAYWWAVKSFQEGCEAFQSIATFRYLREAFLKLANQVAC